MVVERKKRNIGSGGSSRVGAISFDKEAIKNAFKSKAEGNRKHNPKYKRDSGYFTGGRCD
jgi:hypothetical protein